jgi:ABC-2 type transport system ATP-binding protein
LVAEPERAAQALNELGRAGIAVAGFSLDQPSLEEVFLGLTGQSRQIPQPSK